MYERPKNLEIASVLAAISGIISMAAAFIFFDPQSGNMILTVGSLLLLGALFMGIAGGLSTRGQWKWKMAMFMIFMTATITVVAYLFDAFSLELGAILVILALAIAGLTATKKTEVWMN